MEYPVAAAKRDGAPQKIPTNPCRQQSDSKQLEPLQNTTSTDDERTKALKARIKAVYERSMAAPLPPQADESVPFKPFKMTNTNDDRSKENKQPHKQAAMQQPQPSLFQTSPLQSKLPQFMPPNSFAFFNHKSEDSPRRGSPKRQPRAKSVFSSTPNKDTSSGASLDFQFGQLNMSPKDIDDDFDTDMQFLHGETENTSLSDVLTAPIFTRPVQKHLHADTTYDDKPFAQHGLLAGVVDSSLPDPRLFFNVAAPSSTFICGSQGSGKSHTLNCMLENCLLPSVVNTLPRPLIGIVFHYDTFVSDSGGSPCEAAFLSSNAGVKVRVLCAPTNVGHIKRIYSKLKSVTVEPLRINEADLNTQRMLDLMAVSSVQGSLPLYLHVVVRILRDLRIDQQTKGTGFDYSEFKRRLDNEALTDGQLAPLQQRLETLESFMVLEQAKAYDMFAKDPNPRGKISKNGHSKNMRSHGGNTWDPQAGQLTIVDLSCPCVTADMACSLFGICLSLFLEQDTKIGRVVALDEAHKYMTDSAESLALTESLLSTIRLQRHIATRVVVSTQEPTISPRLLDLCSVTIVHRFTSPDWMLALKKHLAGASSWLDSDVLDDLDSEGKNNLFVRETGIRPLQLRETDVVADLFSKIVRLRTGEALMFAPSAVIDLESPAKCLDSPAKTADGPQPFTFGQPPGFAPAMKKEPEKKVISLGNGVLKVRIRKRVTKDGGRSIMAA